MIKKCSLGTKLRLLMAILVITCSCLEHVKGSCLSYGHSCWGAHGKRGGPPKRAVSDEGPASLVFRPQSTLDKTNALPSGLTAADRWALVRVLPKTIPYHPFGKMIHPLPAAPFFSGDDADMVEPGSLSGASGASNKLLGRSADASNESKQTLTSAELGLALDDERQRVVPSKPAPTNNVRRREQSRRKNPSTATRTRYGIIEDSYEDISNMDRIMSQTDEDMLLLDAAAAMAASVSSESDNISGPFDRKLFSMNTKNVAAMNA